MLFQQCISLHTELLCALGRVLIGICDVLCPTVSAFVFRTYGVIERAGPLRDTCGHPPVTSKVCSTTLAPPTPEQAT
jgi:hypothetical protein